MRTYLSLQAAIPADRAVGISVPIDVPDSGRASDVLVRPMVAHDRPSDLRLSLVAPGRNPILIRERQRGHIENSWIRVPSAVGASMAGRWTLQVDDVKRLHGGTVKWELKLETQESASFDLRLVFDRGLADIYRDAFKVGQERLMSFVTGVKVSEPLVLTVYASAIPIDQSGGVLGRAGPTRARKLDGLPFEGLAEFDSADMGSMYADGTIVPVLTHEEGHILGLGTLPVFEQLVKNNFFMGSAAMAAYGRLLGKGPQPVPLENDGGGGTAGGHLEKDVFGPELWTGWISQSGSPISEVSIGIFDDLGYRVDYSKADHYMLGLLALRSGRAPNKGRCSVRPEVTFE